MSGSTRARWQAIAPGRVNLIGEHTDYNGLPVLPIAIDRDVRIEFRVTDDPAVRLGSSVARFDPFAFQLKRPIEAAAQGDWSNYVRAAARGLMEHGVPLERGIEGTVTGDVPIASGLSSSSALVVAAALALLKANGVAVGQGTGPDAPAALSRLELAALMARAERFVGLEGGGMDQAACLHGVAGHALRIEFDPLRVTPVAVPEGWRWVVASSLVRAEKSGGAREAYNERARQCREALGVVGAAAATDETATAGVRAPTVVGAGFGPGSGAGVSNAGGAGQGAPTYRDLVAEEDLDGLLGRARRVLAPVLFRRFRHVVTEGRRVAQAEVAMRDGDMRRFGELMVRSHESLRDDYEVSTRELDAIVEVALGAGAAGARLTGAGFGGCAVVLCDARHRRDGHGSPGGTVLCRPYVGVGGQRGRVRRAAVTGCPRRGSAGRRIWLVLFTLLPVRSQFTFAATRRMLRNPVRQFTAIVEQDFETGLFVGYVPGFPGAHSQASSLDELDELSENLREVISRSDASRRRGSAIQTDGSRPSSQESRSLASAPTLTV